MKELIEELSLVWDSFSEKSQDILSELLGGIREKNKVKALLGKYETRI